MATTREAPSGGDGDRTRGAGQAERAGRPKRTRRRARRQDASESVGQRSERRYERRSVLVPHFGQVTRILPLPRGTLSTVPQPLHLK